MSEPFDGALLRAVLYAETYWNNLSSLMNPMIARWDGVAKV